MLRQLNELLRAKERKALRKQIYFSESVHFDADSLFLFN